MAEFAITGGIGSGKTTVAKQLVTKGATLIDADQIVHDLQQPGGKVFEAIVERFGKGVLTKDGELNRQVIADIVFNEPNQLEDLNKIVHPAVGKKMASLRKEYNAKNLIVLLDIPLLITPEGELGREEYQDFLGKIVVDCETEIAVSRLVVYRGFKEEDARARIAKQATREQRKAHADWLIDNNGTEEDLEEQISSCWAWMRSLTKGK